MQKYTSKNTSINTISKIYTQMEFLENSVILDYGCGKYNTSIEYMKHKDCIVLPFDKYNRTELENNNTLQYVSNYDLDYIVCSNVLNVIYEEDIIKNIIKDIYNYSKKNTIIYISIFEGNKSGIGKVTTKGYQRNEKYKEYLKYLEPYFDITIKKQIFICKRKENI